MLILYNVRYQLWPLDKKIRVVHQAKDYLNRHASEVEQRLAQDRTFKGRVQTAKLKFIKWLQVLFIHIRMLFLNYRFDILINKNIRLSLKYRLPYH